MNEGWSAAFRKIGLQQKRAADAANAMPHGGSLAKDGAQRKAKVSARFVAASADAKRGSRLSSVVGAGWPFPDSFFPFGIAEKQQQLMQAAAASAAAGAAAAVKAAASYILGVDGAVGGDSPASGGGDSSAVGSGRHVATEMVPPKHPLAEWALALAKDTLPKFDSKGGVVATELDKELDRNIWSSPFKRVPDPLIWGIEAPEMWHVMGAYSTYDSA